MTSDHRSSSQRSYRSISSRKERRRNVKQGDDSDSDASSSSSENNSNEKSESESFSGSEDNWEDDYHTSDNDSYYSKKKDEEMGSDDDTSMPEGSEGSTTRSTSSKSKSKSLRSPKSPVSVKSTKSSKSKGSKKNSKKSLKVIDSDIESDSESDSDASSNSGNSSDEDTNSDSDIDSDEDSLYDQRRENKIVRTKLKAIALTALCFVLVTSAVVLGIVMGSKSLKNRKAKADAEAANAPVPTLAPTAEPTAVPTLTPTMYVAPTPIPTDAPSERPTKIIVTGDVPGQDDDFFNNDDFIDDNGIPSETAEESNGDTFVMTLPDGTPFEAPTKPGSSETLLVQGRNSRFDNEPFTNSIEDANSYALMNFNLGDQSWFESEEVLGDYGVKAYVCLEHVPDEADADLWGNAQYDKESGEAIRKVFSICRLKNSVQINDGGVTVEDGKVATGADVESIENPSYSMPEDCVGGKYEKFYVAPDDTLVCIEISQFVENYPPFTTDVQENRMLRRRRLFESGIGKYNEDDSEEADGQPRTPEGEELLGIDPEGGSTIPANRDNATMVEGGDDLIAESRATVTEEKDAFKPEPRAPNDVQEEPPEFLPEFRNPEGEEIVPEFRDPDGEEIVPEFRDPGGAQEAPPELYPPNEEGPDDEEFEFSSTGLPETGTPTASPTTIEDIETKAPEIIRDPSNFKNMLFMVANMEDNQDARAQFYSQNSKAGPSLVLDLKERSPTVSPSPIEGGGTEPESVPEPAPEPAPTVATPAPTFKAEYDPCGVCGNFASFVTLEENKALDIPLDISPLPLLAKNPSDALNTTAICTEWESTCNDGYCTPQLCESLLVAKEFCGCAEPVAQPCNICGEDEELEFPQAMVELTAEQSPKGEPALMTCSFLQGYCEAGFCTADVCSAVQNDSVCSCKSTSPSASPSTLPPTFSPTISPAPTFKAEFERCSICGGPPLEFSLNATVVVELNADITPAPVLNASATCTELESLCEAGYCSDLMCRSYQESVATACGCIPEDNIFAR